ncbi:hypothetical protein PGIGA_G00164340, partial [Pangasianodon gigas]|nr:hypothetical protein [Pangasianodon gigas]
MKPKDRRQIVYFIQDNLNSNISIAASLNLLECLREMKDDSLLSEKFNKYSPLHSVSFTGVQWSLLVYNLLNSEEIQEKFDLKQHAQSSKGLRRLLPVVKITKQAQLDNCNLKKKACKDL